MKTGVPFIFVILISLSFKIADNDTILCSLVKQSSTIVKAKVIEQKRCVRMEDGIEECTYDFKVIKVYKGTIKTEITISTTIMSYAFINKENKMPAAGDELILFLSDNNKELSSFKLIDDWLGVQKYNDVLDKYLLKQ